MSGWQMEPEEPAAPAWWAAIGGGVLFAGALVGLIWVFALIEWLVEALA